MAGKFFVWPKRFWWANIGFLIACFFDRFLSRAHACPEECRRATNWILCVVALETACHYAMAVATSMAVAKPRKEHCALPGELEEPLHIRGSPERPGRVSDLRPEMCCKDLLQRLRDTVVGAFQNSSAPYAKVLEARLQRSGAVKLPPCLTGGCRA